MIRKILFFLFRLLFLFFFVTAGIAFLYRFVNPPGTPLMLIRVLEGRMEGRSTGIEKQWKSFAEISPNLFRAVIASEDGQFLRHNGIDWKAVDRAQKRNEQLNGKKMFGASTITMQTAKNAFLWQGRNYVRKALEAYFTYLIEFFWGKKRILEVYVNIIEWGDGIYGVEAAATAYFQKSAKDLTPREAALLAAVLPNPRRWSPAEPTNYIQKRANFIQGRMNGVALPKE